MLIWRKPVPNDVRSLRAGRGEEERSRERTRGRGRGSFVDYYEDLGSATTKEGYGKWKKGNEDFDDKASEIRGEIEEAQGRYNKAAAIGPGSVPNSGKLYDDAWKSYTKQNDFVKAHVIDKDKVEGTYYVPRAVAAELQKNASEFYHTNMTPGGFYIDVQTKGGGGKRGAELHKALGDAQTQVKTSFDSTVNPQISQAVSNAQAQVSANRSALEGAAANLSQSRGELATQERERDKINQGYKDDYAKRIENIKKTVGAFNVKRGSLSRAIGK